MVIGSIVALLVFLWFYYSAPAIGRNPLHWAIAGFVVYFIIALLWSYFINPAIKDSAMHSRNMIMMLIARYAYIIVSVVGVIVFKSIVGKSKDE